MKTQEVELALEEVEKAGEEQARCGKQAFFMLFLNDLLNVFFRFLFLLFCGYFVENWTKYQQL